MNYLSIDVSYASGIITLLVFKMTSIPPTWSRARSRGLQKINFVENISYMATCWIWILGTCFFIIMIVEKYNWFAIDLFKQTSPMRRLSLFWFEKEVLTNKDFNYHWTCVGSHVIYTNKYVRIDFHYFTDCACSSNSIWLHGINIYIEVSTRLTR